MIRIKKNVDSSFGFLKIGTIKTLPEHVEKEYVRRGIADPYEIKEEKTERQTKELKTEPETKRRGRKPKQ